MKKMEKENISMFGDKEMENITFPPSPNSLRRADSDLNFLANFPMEVGTLKLLRLKTTRLT